MRLRRKIGLGFLGFLTVAIVALGLILGRTEECGPPPEYEGGVESMQAVVYRCYGGPDVLEYREVPKPVPAENEILVRVHNAAANPLDWHYMRGTPYLMRLMSGLGSPTDQRLGVDFAGTVEAVGTAVKQFKPGDEVFGGAGGAFAEYLVVASDRGVTHKPDNITSAQAAAVPIAAITALQALRDKGGIQAGMKVLVNGASGGVGTFAVQIAKAMGAEVTGVCSTRNFEMVRSLGADHVIDYKKDSYVESGQKWDLIIDNVGNHSLLANRKVMSPEGILVMVGGSSGDWVSPLLGPLAALVISPFVDQQFRMFLARLSQDDLGLLADMMEAGQVKPVIDRPSPLAEVPAAIRYSERGRARGKIIIDVTR